MSSDLLTSGLFIFRELLLQRPIDHVGEAVLRSRPRGVGLRRRIGVLQQTRLSVRVRRPRSEAEENNEENEERRRSHLHCTERGRERM